MGVTPPVAVELGTVWQDSPGRDAAVAAATKEGRCSAHSSSSTRSRRLAESSLLLLFYYCCCSLFLLATSFPPLVLLQPSTADHVTVRAAKGSSSGWTAAAAGCASLLRNERRGDGERQLRTVRVCACVCVCERVLCGERARARAGGFKWGRGQWFRWDYVLVGFN